MNEILGTFAEWIANEGYKFDGISIWKLQTHLGVGAGKQDVWYTTEQIVQEFLKSQRY